MGCASWRWRCRPRPCRASRVRLFGALLLPLAHQPPGARPAAQRMHTCHRVATCRRWRGAERDEHQHAADAPVPGPVEGAGSRDPGVFPGPAGEVCGAMTTRRCSGSQRPNCPWLVHPASRTHATHHRALPSSPRPRPSRHARAARLQELAVARSGTTEDAAAGRRALDPQFADDSLFRLWVAA